jgi:hypothetical protein
MPHPPRECWTFTGEPATGSANGGRFVARVLKHLLRAWGVECVAIRDAPPAVSASEGVAQAEKEGDEK